MSKKNENKIKIHLKVLSQIVQSFSKTKSELVNLYIKSNILELDNINSTYLNSFIFKNKNPLFWDIFLKLILFVLINPFKFLLFFLIKIIILFPCYFIKKQNFNFSNSIIFVDIFTHFKIKNNTFSSQYWGYLLPVLRKKNKNFINIHLGYKIYTPFKQKRILNKLISISKKNEKHLLLESFFSLSDAWKIFFNYVLIYVFTLFLILKILFNNNISLSFKLFFYNLFINKFSTKRTINFFIYYYSFKNLFKKTNINFDNISKIIYVSENQPWESILNHLTQNLSNKYAYAHIPFHKFDYRYMSFNTIKEKFPDIKPNYLLISVQEAFQRNKSILTVKSLRFVNQNDYRYEQLKNIYIFGDFNLNNNQLFLNLYKSLSLYFKDVFFKPHPSNKIYLKENYKKDINFFDDDLAFIKNNSLVIASQKTSIIFDCLEYNIPVITINDEKSSPNYFLDYGVKMFNSIDSITRYLTKVDRSNFKNFMKKQTIYTGKKDFWNNL